MYRDKDTLRDEVRDEEYFAAIDAQKEAGQDAGPEPLTMREEIARINAHAARIRRIRHELKREIGRGVRRGGATGDNQNGNR